MLANNKLSNKLFRESDIENRQVGDNQSKKDKENYLKEWEESLKRKEHLLESKHQELKIYSKNLQMQSKGLLKEKLNLGEKIEKYNRLLEQIIDQQTFDTQLTKSNSLTSQTYIVVLMIKDYRKSRKNGINECKERIGNLLKTIRLETKPYLKTQQGSYFSNKTEFEEILFSKRNNHSSSFTGIINLSNKEELVSKQYNCMNFLSYIYYFNNFNIFLSLFNHQIKNQDLKINNKITIFILKLKRKFSII